MLARLVAFAGALGELAQAKPAVSGKGTRAELCGDGESVTVVAVGVLRGITMSRDLTEQSEGPALVTALTALAGEVERLPGDFEGVIEPAGEDVGFTQVDQEERLVSADSHGVDGAHGVFQRRNALGDMPRKRMSVAEAARIAR